MKLRRAILPAINQADFMNAAMGGDPELRRIDIGVFTPGSPLANTTGLEILTGPRDLALAKKLVAESGYKGGWYKTALGEKRSFRICLASDGDDRPTSDRSTPTGSGSYRRRLRHRCQDHPKQVEYIYSERNATIGSRREARCAG